MLAADSIPVKLISLEKNILQDLIDAGKLVNVYLVNGVRLQGYLLSFDTYTLLLKSNQANSEGCLLLYKQAISTVLSSNHD